MKDFVQLIQTGGPSVILAVWLAMEIRERKRLQRLVESFLPLVAETTRAISSVARVVRPPRRARDDADAD